MGELGFLYFRFNVNVRTVVGGTGKMAGIQGSGEYTGFYFCGPQPKEVFRATLYRRANISCPEEINGTFVLSDYQRAGPDQ